MLKGIDVSSYQTVQTLRSCGQLDFVICKASEGIGYKDSRHDQLVTAARKQGLRVGHYDFAWPTNNPEQEAAWFLKCASPRPGDLLGLDLEKLLGSPLTRLDFALRWAVFIRKETGAAPILYSYPNYLQGLIAAATPAALRELQTMPLWKATAGVPANNPGDLYGWPVWTLHQYAAGPYADRDVLNGDESTWDALAIPRAKKTPTPPKTPDPPKAPTPAPTHAPDNPVQALVSQNYRVQLQKILDVTPDGMIGPATIRAWQTRMNTPVDGTITTPSELVRAVQAYIRVVLGWDNPKVDGVFGPMTAKCLESYLWRRGSFSDANVHLEQARHEGIY